MQELAKKYNMIVIQASPSTQINPRNEDNDLENKIFLN